MSRDDQPTQELQDRLRAVLSRAREYGFLGPGPVETHHDHALAFGLALDDAWHRVHGAAADAPRRLVDLGSGGGVPGLVLAVFRPDTEWLFLDANAKRMGVLELAIEELGLADRCRVRTARAEEAGRDRSLRAAFDAVVARGFSGPPVTAECAAPLLRVGGVLVVSEPPGDEDRWPAAGLAPLGMEPLGTTTFSFRFSATVQSTSCPEMYPRRVGIPGKRPLF